MRVLIVTAGSRGDVAPFTGLGQRLQQAGHQVALAAHGRFADLVRGCGLEHRALPGDPVELVRARTAAPSPEAARSVFAAFLDELGDGVIAAVAAGTDILLTASGPAPLSRLVADGFGIPSLGVYLAPGVPTREFPPPGWPVPVSSRPPATSPRAASCSPDRLPLRRRPAAATRPARSPHRHRGGGELAGRLADLPRLQPRGGPPARRLARDRARHRILVAGPTAGMAAPGPAGRLPRRRSASGVHRVRQHDPAPRAAPRRRRGRRRDGPACAPSSSRAGPDSRPPVTTSCWSATCHTTGCSPGRPPWSTTQARAPPGPGSRGSTGGSRARPGRPALLGRQAAPPRRRAAAAAPARADRRHPERRAAVLPRPIDLPRPRHRARPPDPRRRRRRCRALPRRAARRRARRSTCISSVIGADTDTGSAAPTLTRPASDHHRRGRAPRR